MPIREAIVNTLIPKEVEKPIPIRVVSTKPPQIKPKEEAARDHITTIKTEDAAVSAPAVESTRLSPQLSALARKEQAFRQKEQALKDREKALEARLADAEQYAQFKAKLTAKDYSEVEKMGLNYNEYTEYLLNKNKEINPQEEAVKSLRGEIEAIKKSTEENATKEYDETVAEYKKEIAALIATNPIYSSVKELKREDAVLQLILDSWEEDGQEVTVEQAAKDIEDALIEDAMKMASLSKIKARKEEEKASKPTPLPKPGLKTLTNQMTVSSEKKPVKSLQYLSESERYAEARRRVEARKQGQ